MNLTMETIAEVLAATSPDSSQKATSDRFTGPQRNKFIYRVYRQLLILIRIQNKLKEKCCHKLKRGRIGKGKTMMQMVSRWGVKAQTKFIIFQFLCISITLCRE
jgi:hypothetical protein